MLEDIRFAILIVSDRAAYGIREDQTAPRLKSLILKRKGMCDLIKIIPDDAPVLKTTILEWAEPPNLDVILTSGGTGITPRDITVDVTLELLEKELPGFGEEMRRQSLQFTSNAILSRATAGIIRNKLLVNLPGSPQGAVDCLNWILTPLRHGVRLLKQQESECPVQPIRNE